MHEWSNIDYYNVAKHSREPLVDSSSLITQGHSHCPDFAEVKVVAIVVVVWGYPPNPHTGRVLTSKDPH